MRQLLLTVTFAIAFSSLFAQATEKATRDRTFQLGEATIPGAISRDGSQRLTSSRIEKFNRTDLSNALNLLPGVSIANVGPRNESVVYVRGFDLRQVPVVLDHYNEHIVASPTLSVFLKDVSNEKNRKTLFAHNR